MLMPIAAVELRHFTTSLATSAHPAAPVRPIEEKEGRPAARVRPIKKKGGRPAARVRSMK
jgi:hypothetical protein